MKRIAFVINRMNFRASSGHGIFMKGVVDTLLKQGHHIDIICDGEPEDNFLAEYNVNVYYPDKSERLTYGKHSTLFQFSDSFNFEKSINFRTAIVKALSNHVYNLVICNDTESAFVCYQLELYKHMKVASYTHECASINPELGEGVFKDCYYDLIERMMYFPIVSLIQTEKNKEKLLANLPFSNPNVYIQPYPLTDSNDLGIQDKDGILFIGRHEDRKNPDAFIKLLAGIKQKYGVEVKAKVLTRTAHVKKFEADFAAIGHTNYEIKADVVGDEKAKMIQSAKLAFLPYKNESFGIAVLECLKFMPTVVLDKSNWWYNFSEMSNLLPVSNKEAVDKVWDAYNNFRVNKELVQQEFTEYQSKYESALLKLLEGSITYESNIEPRNRLYNKLKENRGQYISLTEYFETENSKGVIYLTSDIEAIYSNSKWYQVHHTNTHTYLGIPDEFGKLEIKDTPKVSETLSEFFQ